MTFETWKMPRRAFMAMTALGAVDLARAQPATAYPTRPVRFIVPYAPGGPLTRWRG